ncbi:MAG TPA: Wzz/FepE/Etk N-terminal domain-containing protein [Solirubrobacterales bacterium]|nr:Wzz/FepE/Etk N-terminal domain-containing protein [Solirubrobacterales bacterium]
MNDREGLLEQLLRVVRRRKWIVLQAVVAVPLLAFVFSISQEKEYTAEATLLFRQAPVLEETSTVIDPNRVAATNGELVGLPVVAERAAEELEDVPAGEVLASVTVTPSTEADTATIEATTPDPERSAAIANAYGNAYIDFRRRADRAQVQDAINLAESSLAELTPAEEAGAEGAALNEQLDKLRLSQALQTGGAELVQTASPPSDPSSPKPLRNTVIGFVLGLLLGLSLAALLERIDRRVRTSEEMEDLYSLPVLARIPRSPLLGAKRTRSLGTRTPEGEAFRVLRTNLRFFDVDRDMRSILIVSPEEGDGKSTVAQGLATTMAEMGDDVVLVETDLRKGGAFRQVDGRPAEGLSSVLAGTPLEKVLIKVDVPLPNSDESRLLAVLPSGPAPPNPSELLEGERMRAVLDELSEHFRFVILDSPALGAVSDALALVPAASQIVVVGGLGKTTREAARALLKQFSLLKRQPIGVIVNFAEPERAKYSHYYRSEPAGSEAPS